jgi:hypothetical protein
MVCVARIFGLAFALAVPLRMLHTNSINCCASLGAMWRYTKARALGQPLVWLKTEHAYPTLETLQMHRRELDEVLVTSGIISADELALFRNKVDETGNLADLLLLNRAITEHDLCRAISLQSGLPASKIDLTRVKPQVVRSLPAHVSKRFDIVPFQVRGGHLLVAGTRVPPPELAEELKTFTRLPVEVHLVTKATYEQLQAML